MENQSYYSSGRADNGTEDLSRPVVVNCTGFAAIGTKFTTVSRRQDYYLQLMETGRLTCENQCGEQYTLSPGEFIIRPPNTSYTYTQAPGCTQIGYYWVHFTGGYVGSLLDQCGLEPDRVERLTGDIPSEVSKQFSTMFREFITRDEGFEELCGAVFTALLVSLSRFSRSSSRPDPRFTSLLEYIHRHFAEELSIPELASRENLSVSRFRQLFRETTGASPSDYITALRINNARELLMKTNLSVSEIAELCGYSDVFYFMRVFKKRNGVTAGAFRNGI